MQFRKKLSWSAAKEMYDQGKTDAEIAQLTGVCKGTVQSWRNQHCLPANVPGRGKKRKLTQLEQDAREAHEHHMTYAQWKNCGEKGQRYG